MAYLQCFKIRGYEEDSQPTGEGFDSEKRLVHFLCNVRINETMTCTFICAVIMQIGLC